MTPVIPTFASVLNYGALVVFFVVVMGIALHYYLRVRPKEHAAREQRDEILLQQVTLATKAIETSNLVIAQNSDEMRENRASHNRINDRLVCVEDEMKKVAIDTAVIRSKVE